MSFLHGTEEYYQKFIELQEKLRSSEEGRLKLEMKFNEMVQVTREEEQIYYRKLRTQYKRFLEEDTRRQERNERILRILERIESRAAMLAAKTERFELLRKQYHAYLKRVFAHLKHQTIQSDAETQQDAPRMPTIAEQRQAPNLYNHPTVRKALFGDKNETNRNPKVDVVKQYLNSLSSPTCREDVLKATRSSEQIPLTTLIDSCDNNGSSESYGDEFDFPKYKSNASNIADQIIDSIYSRPRPIAADAFAKYQPKEQFKESKENFNNDLSQRFCGTKLFPENANPKNPNDVEVFAYYSPKDKSYKQQLDSLPDQLQKEKGSDLNGKVLRRNNEKLVEDTYENEKHNQVNCDSVNINKPASVRFYEAPDGNEQEGNIYPRTPIHLPNENLRSPSACTVQEIARQAPLLETRNTQGLQQNVVEDKRLSGEYRKESEHKPVPERRDGPGYDKTSADYYEQSYIATEKDFLREGGNWQNEEDISEHPEYSDDKKQAAYVYYDGQQPTVYDDNRQHYEYHQNGEQFDARPLPPHPDENNEVTQYNPDEQQVQEEQLYSGREKFEITNEILGNQHRFPQLSDSRQPQQKDDEQLHFQHRSPQRSDSRQSQQIEAKPEYVQNQRSETHQSQQNEDQQQHLHGRQRSPQRGDSREWEQIEFKQQYLQNQHSFPQQNDSFQSQQNENKQQYFQHRSPQRSDSRQSQQNEAKPEYVQNQRSETRQLQQNEDKQQYLQSQHRSPQQSDGRESQQNEDKQQYLQNQHSFPQTNDSSQSQQNENKQYFQHRSPQRSDSRQSQQNEPKQEYMQDQRSETYQSQQNEDNRQYLQSQHRSPQRCDGLEWQQNEGKQQYLQNQHSFPQPNDSSQSQQNENKQQYIQHRSPQRSDGRQSQQNEAEQQYLQNQRRVGHQSQQNEDKRQYLQNCRLSPQRSDSSQSQQNEDEQQHRVKEGYEKSEHEQTVHPVLGSESPQQVQNREARSPHEDVKYERQLSDAKQQYVKNTQPTYEEREDAMPEYELQQSRYDANRQQIQGSPVSLQDDQMGKTTQDDKLRLTTEFNEKEHQIYDENAQRLQFDKNGQPPQYNSNAEQMQCDEYAESAQHHEQGQPAPYVEQYDEQRQSAQYVEQYHEQGPFQHDAQAQLVQCDDQGQPLQSDVQGQPIQYDSQGQPIQYDSQGQPIQYDEQGQPIQYDEQGQPIQYDEQGQPIEYDNQGKHIEYDAQGQPIQYDQVQPIQYIAQGQPIQYNDQNQPDYDEHGNVIYYDNKGQPIQYDSQGRPMHYNESEQVVQYDEHGQPIRYDEHGQIVQYDEHGQPVQYLGHEQYYPQYDDEGQPIQQYDETGQPMPEYDENGRPVQQFDERGQPIPQYDENGQPLYQYDHDNQYYQGDESGQVGQQYDRSGPANSSEKIQQEQKQPEEPSATENKMNDVERRQERSPQRVSDQKLNVMDMLDTDTESAKQETKVSNDSDFDFSNT